MAPPALLVLVAKSLARQPPAGACWGKPVERLKDAQNKRNRHPEHPYYLANPNV